MTSRLAVVLIARNAAGDRMFAVEQPAPTIPTIDIGVVGGLSKHTETAVGLTKLHDPIVRNVTYEQASLIGEIHRPLRPAHAICTVWCSGF